MRYASLLRPLRPTEMELARQVFHGTLPPWGEIGITDALGVDDTVWTMTRSMAAAGAGLPPTSHYRYFINFGDAAKVDLSVQGVPLNRYVPGYSAIEDMADVFIHEMTHVWQYSRPDMSTAGVALRCVYAQKLGAGYRFDPVYPWNAYNLEQQAHIVEKWSARGRKEDDELFPFIHYVVRREGHAYKPKPGSAAFDFDGHTFRGVTFSERWFEDTANLGTLQLLLDGERVGGMLYAEPVRTVSRDDSFVVVLTSDVLFDFDRATLKDAADRPLEVAWSKIKEHPRRRRVVVNGHTDGLGDDAYNKRLSERRAKAVAEWFVQRGYLTAAAVEPQGRGSWQPADTNKTAAGRAKNRRVEIYLHND